MGLFIGTEAELAASRKKGRSKGGKAFDKEFARQKAKGAKNFTFGGKRYSTKLASGGTAKSTTAAVKPKGGSAPTTLAKKTTVLPKPAPRSAASGLPDKGVPLPKSAPRGPNASVSSDVPTPTRKPYPPSSNRPDNVGNTPAPRAQKPVYFGPTEQRTPDERKAATKTAMDKARQNVKDISAKRQMDRNTPPKPTAFAKPDPGLSPAARGYLEKAKAKVAAGQHPTLRPVNRPPDNVGNRPTPMAKRPDNVGSTGTTPRKPVSSLLTSVRDKVLFPPKPQYTADPARTAADVMDTRKRMDLVTKSPSPRGPQITHASVKQAGRPANVGNAPGVPQGKLPLTPPTVKSVSSATVAPNKFTQQQKLDAAMAAARQRSARADQASRAPANQSTAKAGRVVRQPVASVKAVAVAPKGDRLKKKVDVDSVFKKRW